MNKTNTVYEGYNLIVAASSENIWERFQAGDEHAFNSIYHTHIDDLYHYGMHFCRDAEKVKDCLQDLFHGLWYDREHLSNDVENIHYYLISSLRRRLLRSLEKERRNSTVELVDTFDFQFVPSNEDAIIRNEVYREQARQLHNGIAMLSRRQREAVYLRFYQNLSYEEVANLMMMKVESVYNVISKAVGVLKNLLGLLLWVLALQW